MATTKQGFRAGLAAVPMYWIFVLSYTTVHAIFEYKFWIDGGGAIFAKYESAAPLDLRLTIAERVYYTKATWFFLFFWMQVLGARFKTALACSFLVYAVELILFFPVRIYSLLNLALAAGMVIETVVQRRRENASV